MLNNFFMGSPASRDGPRGEEITRDLPREVLAGTILWMARAATPGIGIKSLGIHKIHHTELRVLNAAQIETREQRRAAEEPARTCPGSYMWRGRRKQPKQVAPPPICLTKEQSDNRRGD